jgi:23S rRNA U2552 (ribose-2'-O)-methylase RlmE/FtsJ
MQKIGLEMNDATAALSLDHSTTSPKRVLDLCSAPGGYSTEILRLNPSATIDAISLPAEDGGHRVLIPFGTRDPRVQYLFTDITMLATEYGVDINEIPADHPDAGKFKRLRPYKGKEYDLVFCDGQVLRTHERESYRESCEATRLTNAQLILGLQRIKEGGTFVILLHRLDSWDSVMLVRSFCMFADIQLFKPVKAHAMVSSFYMVAKNVQLENGEVRVAVEGFRERWYKATFETDSPREVVREEDVAAVLEEFGPRLVELGRGIWKVQADALEKAPFMKDGVGGEEGGEVDDAGGRGPSTLARVE